MIRVFVSVKVPVTEKMEEALNSLKNVKNVRVVNPSQIHLTLSFIGDIDVKKAEKLCNALDSELSGFGEFRLCAKGTGYFPPKGNPRVVWLGFENSEKLMELAEKVRNVLDSLKIKYDDKKFSPHITLGRINGVADIKDFMNQYGKEEFCSFECSSLNVMKSELSPKGAKHTVLKTVDFHRC